MSIRDLTRQALRGIAGNSLRSWMIGLCAFLVAGFVLATVIVVQGAQDSLSLARDRLGADIVVVPQGSESMLEGALLMGNATNTYMPRAYVERVAQLPGVEVASPQLYLMSMSDSSCCVVPSMLMVAYDSKSDFAIEPWLEKELGRPLALGESVGGTHVFVPKGQSKIKLYGYDLALLGNLEPTGTNLDRTLFMTFPTAYKMAQVSQTQAAVPLPILQDKVSSIMVKIAADADPDAVAGDIQSSLQNVTATVSPEMFGTYRSQVSGLMRTMLIVLALTVALAAGITALVFWMAVHDRRRQIGVLRALGATQRYVMASYMTEALLLALAGGIVGVVLAAFGLFLFRDALVAVLGFPFLFPSIGWLTGLVVGGLVVALLVVAAAAALPAWRAAREEPADAMRE